MADQVGPQPSWYNESGILTIPIRKSAPGLPERTGTGWFDRNWPMVAMVSVGMVLVGLVNRNRKK